MVGQNTYLFGILVLWLRWMPRKTSHFNRVVMLFSIISEIQSCIRVYEWRHMQEAKPQCNVNILVAGISISLITFRSIYRNLCGVLTLITLQEHHLRHSNFILNYSMPYGHFQRKNAKIYNAPHPQKKYIIIIIKNTLERPIAWQNAARDTIVWPTWKILRLTRKVPLATKRMFIAATHHQLSTGSLLPFF